MQIEAHETLLMAAGRRTRGVTRSSSVQCLVLALTYLLAGPFFAPDFAAVRAQETGSEIHDPAQASQRSDVAREAINGLWSPYCPGLMLEVCTSQGGAAMRDSIETQAASGMSADAIVDYWVAQFGEKYRAEPDFSGVGRFAWLTPYAALLAGVLLAVGVLAGRRSRNAGGVVAEVTPAQEERLTAALAELDRSEAPDF